MRLAAPAALAIGIFVSAACLEQSYSAHQEQCAASKALMDRPAQSQMDMLQKLYPACTQPALSIQDDMNALLGGIIIAGGAYIFFLGYGKIARWLSR